MQTPLLFFFATLQVFQINTITCNGDNVFPNITTVLVFGDSSVDTGNNNYVTTFVKANHNPYGQNFPGQVPTGRFSDGKLVPDFLVSTLGIKETIPPFLQPNLSNFELIDLLAMNSISGYKVPPFIAPQVTLLILLLQLTSWKKAFPAS